MSLTAVVDDYLKHYASEAADLHSHFGKSKTLNEVIAMASSARLPSGKKHSHQACIPDSVLKEVENILLKSDLDACKTFDDLHHSVEDALEAVEGVGPLEVHDTAHRIGAYKKLNPEFVYLHAGTLEGAKILITAGKITATSRNLKRLSRNQLPKEFKKLSAEQIEDCLCIYRSNF